MCHALADSMLVICQTLDSAISISFGDMISPSRVHCRKNMSPIKFKELTETKNQLEFPIPSANIRWHRSGTSFDQNTLRVLVMNNGIIY